MHGHRRYASSTESDIEDCCAKFFAGARNRKDPANNSSDRVNRVDLLTKQRQNSRLVDSDSDI